MTPLIDYTYMIGDIRLALQNNQTGFDELVEVKQDDYLKMVLGEIEFQNFVTDYETDAKWINFLNAGTLTVTDKNGDSKTVQYKGFKNLLAYFMYIEYLYNFESKQTAAGKRQQELDNSVHINPSGDIARTWRKTIDQFYGMDWKVLHANYNSEWFGTNRYSVAYFPNAGSYDYWSFCSQYYSRINTNVERIKGTVYNYLYYNQSDFPDWNFTTLEKTGLNELNI